MTRFEFTIDKESCWGCKTCEVACKQEHRMPEGVHLIRISENRRHASDEKRDFVYHVTLCRHCDAPPCAEVCPEDAIYKRDDGIVVLDSDRCTGCETCLDSCPYGAISMDMEAGVARKCNLCHERVDKGLYPACADNICLGHCIRFKALPASS